jgi:NAD(P)H-quinone oxidoreductase subunit I
LVKGMIVTFKHLFRHPITTQYPEQRLVPSRRTRGNELVWNNVKCVACTTCAKTCPQGAIHMVTAPDPSNPNKLIMVKIEVDTGYCISCGMCVESCPYNALHMGYAYEKARYRRKDLIQSNEALLASETRIASAFMHPDMEKDLPEQTLLIDRNKKKALIKPPADVNSEPPTPPPESTPAAPVA